MSRKAQDIAAEAMHLSGRERTCFIEESCAGDVALRTSVERLIELQDSMTIAGDGGRRPVSTPRSRDDSEATWIGGFRVIERLGSGAMGVVYLAEQQHPRRLVALKVIRPDVISEDLVRRFRLEADALARLKHEGIAQVYQSGVALLDGVDCPYFAMELVDGVPLDQHARTLDRKSKARLLEKVCEAVAHAHQKGIVHRDLKPANILVDAEGRPKVLDFGVARGMSTDGEEEPADLAGTIAYMSPEQLSVDPDIDTRADVFALGLIMYELFAGERPYRVSGLRLEEARAAVFSSDPKLLEEFDSSLRGDLTAIALRAIAFDRENRYASAGALAEDIRRWLSTRPVQARPQSSGYLLTRYAQRHRGLVAAFAIALVMLIGGVAGITWQAIEATRGRTRALQEAARANAVSDFLIQMLASADPERALGADLTVRDLLDTTAASLDSDLADQPVVEMAVQHALASTYFGLGELEKADRHARAAIALAEDQFGDRDARTLDARRLLAAVLVERGEYDESETLMQQVIDRYQAIDPLEADLARSDLARIMHESGHPEEAMALWNRVRTSITQTLPPDDKRSLVVLHNYASALSAMSRFDEAEPLFREVIERRSRVYGFDHPQTLASRNMLAGTIQKQGREREAADMLRGIYEARLAALGPDHFATLNSMGSLAVPLIRLGEYEEAEQLVRATLRGFRAQLGSEHSKTLIVMGNLAYLLEDLGKVEEAAALYRETIDVTKRVSGARSPDTWSPMNNLAMLLEKSGDHEGALLLYEELLALCSQVLPADHIYTALFTNNYAATLMSLGRLDDARSALDASHPVIESIFGVEHERTKTSNDRRERLTRLEG